MEKVIPIAGDETPNDWFECADWKSCGHLDVHPNGVRESCPECGSGLERYSGQLYECAECGVEHISHGDAKDCYHSH